MERSIADHHADTSADVRRWRLTPVTGPDAGPGVVLGPGTHRIGRHPRAEIHVVDAHVEPFHLSLTVTDDGDLRAVQLAGRRSTGPGDAPWDDAGAGAVRWHLGATTVEVQPIIGAPGGFDGAAPPAGVVRRRARASVAWTPTPIRVDPTSAGGLAGTDDGESTAGVGLLAPAGVALGGAVVMALLLRQPMFAAFGALGATAAIASWAVQRRSSRHRRRRIGRRVDAAHLTLVAELARERAAWIAQHTRTTGSLPDAAATLLEPVGRHQPGGPTEGVWDRRPDHPDVWTVALGLGDQHWTPVIGDPAGLPRHWWAEVESASVVADLAVPADLRPGTRLAVRGPGARAVLRSLVLQLAVRTGPADWQLVVVTSEPTAWGWLTGLPHAVGSDGAVAILDDEGAMALVRDPTSLGARYTLLVTDASDDLAVRTSAIRRLLALEASMAVLALVDATASLGPGVSDPPEVAAPAGCTAMLITRDDGTARWMPDLRVGEVPTACRWTGAGLELAARMVTALARLHDPEDPRRSGAVPSEVDLADLVGLGRSRLAAETAGAVVAALVERWTSSVTSTSPTVPIGLAADGAVEIDLVRDGPHALIAGTTGSGKSELLRSLVVGLATRQGPDRICFVLIDYKGGAAFDSCTSLPHVVGLVTDLDDQLADRALRSLRAELRHRERVLRTHGAADLDTARRAAAQPVLPRLVVVVDEFATLAAEQPAFLHALVDIAQRGRSVGVHLVLATQRPSGVVGDDVRANTNLRLCLRVQDTADSLEVLGDTAAALLSRRHPGRAVLRLGPDELVTFQAARVSPGLVETIASTARSLGLDAPRRPWTDPLPERLTRRCVGQGAVALVDLPDEQRVREVVWTPDRGHLLAVGSPGSGVSSTLRTLALAAIRAGAAVTVLDAGHDRSWDEFAHGSACAGVIRPTDGELLLRALIDATALPPITTAVIPTEPPRVLVIDGVAALRTALEPPERATESDLLQRVLGSTGAVVLLLGADTVTGAPPWLCSRVPHRWLLHLDDRSDAPSFGIAAALVPEAIPGRIAIVGDPDATLVGAAAQLVEPAESSSVGVAAAGPTHRGPVPRLRTLPVRIDARELPASTSAGAPPDADGWTAWLGTRFDSLAPAALEVPAGEHLLILGPARSGRSTCLVRLLAAWHQAHEAVGLGPRWVGVLTPRRSPLGTVAGIVDLHALGAEELLDGLPATGQALLVIDDAELVDDVDGRLAELLRTPRPGWCAVVAARPDGLRGQYGHWTNVVRRSRRGVITSASSDLDGDLLGAVLPRRLPIPPRPGLVHVVADGDLVLVQVATDHPHPATITESACSIVVGA